MRFRLLAIAPDGRPRQLSLEAPTPHAARQIAAEQSLRIVSLHQMREWSLGGLARRRRQPLRSTAFVQEILALLEAGLTITEAIDALISSEADAATRELLAGVATRMAQGRSFSDALELAGGAFPHMLVATVRSSERSGGLPDALQRYAEYASTADELGNSVRTSLTYPALLVAVGCAVVVFLLGFVVPKFSEVYRETGRDLPALSHLLLVWGAFARNHWAIALSGAVVLAAALAAGARHAIVSGRLRRWVLALPALARLISAFERIRLYRGIAMLLRAGIPLAQSLEECAYAVPERLSASVKALAGGLRVGQPLSDLLEGQALADGISLRLLRAGERSGRLAEMLERAAAFEEQRLTRALGMLTRMLEPVLMAALGIVIGGIVVLMYLPIFDLAAAIE